MSIYVGTSEGSTKKFHEMRQSHEYWIEAQIVRRAIWLFSLSKVGQDIFIEIFSREANGYLDEEIFNTRMLRHRLQDGISGFIKKNQKALRQEEPKIFIDHTGHFKSSLSHVTASGPDWYSFASTRGLDPDAKWKNEKLSFNAKVSEQI